MNGYAKTGPAGRRRPTTQRRPGYGVAIAAAVVAMIAVGACGSPSTDPSSPQSPAPTASAGEEPGSAELGRAATDDGTEEGSGTSDNPEPAPTPQPLQIEVATSPPTASYPCHPAGTIMVSGGGSSGDSDELPGSAEYPLEVTYQWFIRKVNHEGVAGTVVPIGPPGTLQFNHAGGIPVSGPELDPAPHIEMELRIVDPETIFGGWIAHPDCA